MYNRTDPVNEVIALASAYYEAMVNADEAQLRQVFHPKASIIGNAYGALEFDSLDAFIAGTCDAKTGKGPFEYHVDSVVVKGDTAAITVGGYSYGAWITDHLSLLKIDDQWQIVAKTFYIDPTA